MFNPKKKVLAIAGVATVAALALAGCSSSGSLSGGSGSGAKESIVVGSANFSENTILAQVYGQALADG